jgi:hypothetical protein
MFSYGDAGLGMSESLGAVSISAESATHINRVNANGGTVQDPNFLNQQIANAMANDYWTDIVAGWSPSWGVKGTTTASKIYSITGAGQDQEQTTGSKQFAITQNGQNGRPIFEADGIDDFITKAFAFNLPATIILMGFKQKSWTINEFLFDGQGAITGGLKQVTATPSITQQVAADVGGTPNSDLAVNTAAHVEILFNQPTGAHIRVDSNAAVDTGVTTVANLSGFSFGGKFNDTLWAEESVGAILCMMPAVDASRDAKMAAIRAFSKEAYNTP